MDDLALRATIGLSASEFNQLVQIFAQEIEKEEWLRYERGLESIEIHYFYKKLKVDSAADNGNCTIIVLNPGKDKAYDDSEYCYIDNILDLDGEGPEPGVIDVSSRTQEEIAAIISDIIYATGSDDFMWIGNIVVA